MICQRCSGKRVVSVSAKCSDRCVVDYPDGMYVGRSGGPGYVPTDLGIGGYDYIKMSHCLACGQIQGDFPVRPNG